MAACTPQLCPYLTLAHPKSLNKHPLAHPKSYELAHFVAASSRVNVENLKLVLLAVRCPVVLAADPRCHHGPGHRVHRLPRLRPPPSGTCSSSESSLAMANWPGWQVQLGFWQAYKLTY